MNPRCSKQWREGDREEREREGGGKRKERERERERERKESSRDKRRRGMDEPDAKKRCGGAETLSGEAVLLRQPDWTGFPSQGTCYHPLESYLV